MCHRVGRIARHHSGRDKATKRPDGPHILFQGILRQGKPHVDTLLPRPGTGMRTADACRREREIPSAAAHRYP